jgi:uncharacterized phage-associated protein
MLDEADRVGRPITNLALQKLLYFVHSLFLIEHKRPLISGYFEAWRLGPVHPAVYSAFKQWGDKPIQMKACKRNVLTGEKSEIPLPSAQEVLTLIAHVMRSYGKLTPGRLVDLAHAKGAPWDTIVAQGSTGVAVGLRIPDELIIQRFKHHKISVWPAPGSEDTELGVLMELEVGHGETEVHPGIQA